MATKGFSSDLSDGDGLSGLDSLSLGDADVEEEDLEFPTAIEEEDDEI